jgi:hypothetical protein
MRHRAVAPLHSQVRVAAAPARARHGDLLRGVVSPASNELFVLSLRCACPEPVLANQRSLDRTKRASYRYCVSHLCGNASRSAALPLLLHRSSATTASSKPPTIEDAFGVLRRRRAKYAGPLPSAGKRCAKDRRFALVPAPRSTLVQIAGRFKLSGRPILNVK